jgi:pimeloyl-ACP methyl ester carboxylesterase
MLKLLEAASADGRAPGLWIGPRGLSPERPTVVLVHGAGGSRLAWSGQIRALDREVNVVVPELPGHGRTRGPLIASVQGYAAWIIRILETLALPGPPILGGISLGGTVVLEAALWNPDRAAGLILMATSANPPVDPALVRELEADYPAGLNRFAARLFSRETAPVIIKNSLDLLNLVPQAVLRNDLSAGRAYDRRDQLARIEQPTLVLCGELDQMMPVEHSRFLAGHIPAARLKIVKNAGHLLNMEAPGQINRAILDFVHERVG